MRHKQLLARLPICLASGDHDVTSWSLYLIHDIAKSGKIKPCQYFIFKMSDFTRVTWRSLH